LHMLSSGGAPGRLHVGSLVSIRDVLPRLQSGFPTPSGREPRAGCQSSRRSRPARRVSSPHRSRPQGRAPG